ncbi:hypothetical protein V8E51_006684 [Hyaloscypha variabilis]
MSTDAMAVVATESEPVGLHSPPDSNSAPKDAGSDSELSDLEPDPEPEPESNELHDLKPDHYSDGGVPVFRPSMDEFADFQRYMRGINSYGMRTGIVKVIPPPEWVAAQPRLDDAIKTIRVKEPIKQDIMGTSGTYRQANFMHQRSYNLPQWRQLCEQSEHQPPAKRGERRLNQDKYVPRTKSSGTPSSGSKKKGSSRSNKVKGKSVVVDPDDGTSTPDRLPTPVSPTMKAEDDTLHIKEEADDTCDTPTKRMGGRQPKSISVSSRRKNNRSESAAVDEAAFKDFKYELEGEDYSPERCEELERAYWKTLTYASPLYGADMPGTLFDDRTTTWNLGKLENLLDVLGTKIPGVNTAYLYLGMWKATFAWHLEDVDLYSINYLHFGAPKQWYSISQGDARRFEAAMKTIWPVDAKACDQFLRHKTFLISPAHLLANFNIKVNKIVHNPGEFVITFPYGYHSGYNLGYNCAEAVNFALDSWLEFGRVAKKCDCSQAQDSVWINVHEIERKMRGEETEYEETDDEEEEEEDEDLLNNLPTPPESSGDTKIKAPRKKRKRPSTEKGDNLNVKRIRVRIRAPTREPCILCPNDIPSEPLLLTEDGQKAHRICALYIPETSIETGDTDTVIDVKYINKDRMELKCNYCRVKKGACFQCSQKKCTRAYHATCAAAAGVLVEQGEIPVFGKDGTEYKEWGIEFSCRFHRAKRDKKFDGDALGDDERILKAASELKVGEVCQMQYYKGDIFAGAVVENRKSEQMVLVDILPRGQRVEVEYKWLLIPDPAHYRLPKPSPNAKPMPKSFKDKESLNTSKRQADDLPRADDVFVKGFTWAEFKNHKLVRNPAQVKVDLARDSQIWFYLGKTSTEAKAQFTEDPAKPRHNPKGHFLDTIPKPSVTLPRQSYAATYPSGLSQNTLAGTKAPIRPSLPTATSSSRPEKPYVYKPRNTDDMYRVDPQAYRSQQNFLQRAAPYSFGTDPRWRPTESNPAAPYVQNNTTATASLPPSSARAPSWGNASPVTAVPPSPSSRLHYSQNPSPVGNYPAPPANRAPLAPPLQAPYRPSYTQAPPVPPKANNPFSGRPQASSSRPNPFAKYSYLQKEHNRSPLEYKSPYRPGGGFMNGYQGSLEKHLQQTLFRNKPGSGTPSSNPLMSYGNNPKSPYTPSQTSPSPSYSMGTPSSYGEYGTPTAQGQVQQSTTNDTALNTWGKNDTSQLHPAIRQEYSSMFNHHQPAQQSPTSQHQGPILQAPAMYDRPQSHRSYHNHTPQARSQQQGTPQHAQQSGQQQQGTLQSVPQPPISQAIQLASSTQSPTLPSSTGQYYRPGSSAETQSPSYPTASQHQYQPHPSAVAQSPAHASFPQSQYQAPPQVYQENKPLYPHQQYFQNPESRLQAQHQGQPPGQAQALQPLVQGSQARDFPDVPADSTSIIEKMMRNLKKATPAASANI